MLVLPLPASSPDDPPTRIDMQPSPPGSTMIGSMKACQAESVDRMSANM